MNVSGVGKMGIGKGNALEGSQFATHVAGKDIWRRGATKGHGRDTEMPGAERKILGSVRTSGAAG